MKWKRKLLTASPLSPGFPSARLQEWTTGRGELFRRAIFLLLSVLLFSSAGSAEGAAPLRLSVTSPPAEGRSETAEIPAGGKPLTLAECVAVALDENPLLQAAQLGVEAAREGVGAARAPYWPQLSARGAYHRGDRVIFLPSGVGPAGGTANVGARDEWEAAVEGEYLLYDSGRRRAELLSALAGREIAVQEAAKVRQDLILEVHDAFFSLLGALAEEEAAGESLARSREHLRLAELRLEAGDVPPADVLRARVEVSSAQLTQVAAGNAIRVARAELNAAMGLPALLPVLIESDGPAPLDPGSLDPQAAVARALARRPEIDMAGREVSRAGYRMEAVRGAYGPNLQAEGKYGRRDDRFLPDGEEWSAGVSLRVPLFTGFEKTHRVAEAEIERKRRQAEADRTALLVQSEVAQAYSRLLEAWQSVRTTETMLADADESRRLTRARYESGAATINDLLDAEAALTGAKTEWVQAIFGHRLETSRFLRATGELEAPAGSSAEDGRQQDKPPANSP